MCRMVLPALLLSGQSDTHVPPRMMTDSVSPLCLGKQKTHAVQPGNTQRDMEVPRLLSGYYVFYG